MIKQEFINSVLAEPNVLELLPGTDQVIEIRGADAQGNGGYEKGYFEVLLNEPQGGKNFRQVWYIRNRTNDETSYQTANTIDLKKNTFEAKLDVLQKYLAANFLASHVLIFTGEDWAEVEVYANTNPTITKKKVFVFKQNTNSITHRDLLEG